MNSPWEHFIFLLTGTAKSPWSRGERKKGPFAFSESPGIRILKMTLHKEMGLRDEQWKSVEAKRDSNVSKQWRDWECL